MQPQHILQPDRHGARWGLVAGVVVVLATAAGSAPAAAAAHCQGAHRQAAAGTHEQAVAAVACLVNRARARRGLPRLRANARLARAAAAHASAMVHGGFFAHTTPGGATVAQRLSASGYIRAGRPWSVGETLACGTGRLATAASVVRAWLRSPGHRRVLLSRRFREVGIGVAAGLPIRGVRNPAGATFVGELGVRSS